MKIQGIAFVGKMGSGKTTAASILCDEFKCTKLSFATQLKNIASEFYGMHDKNRVLLQTLGTAMRSVDKNVFVNALKREMEEILQEAEKTFFVIDDVRYLNEFEFLRDCGFHMVYIYREALETDTSGTDTPETNHESELLTSLPEQCSDVISNTESVRSLEIRVRDIYCQTVFYPRWNNGPLGQFS